RLAGPGRADPGHLIERLGAVARSFDEDPELIADLFLPDIFAELARAERALERLFLGSGRLAGHHALQLVVLDHGAAEFNSVIPSRLREELQRLANAVGDGEPVGQLLHRRDRLLVAVAQ